MSMTVDTLITEFAARDLQTPVVQRMAQEVEELGRATDRATRASERHEAASHRISRAHATLTSGISRMVGVFAGLEVAQRALDFKSKAEEAASEYASLEARLTALVGTHEAASRKLKMAELVSAPSPFTTKQLSNAATTLEAFGLNSERLLPILGKLGAAMGATDEKLEVFTRGFGKLGQGEMIDSDVLSAMGVTKLDFAAKGIQFDGQGKLLSSAKESLTALEAIIEERFGNIFEQMASTPEAKRASFEDAGERVMRYIGQGMLKSNAPLFDAMSTTLNALANSGIVQIVASDLSKSFLSVFGKDTSDGMMRLTANFFAALDLVPDAAGKAFRYVSDLFATIWKNLQLMATWGMNALAGFFGSSGSAGAVGYVGQGDLKSYERDHPDLRVMTGGISGGEMGNKVGDKIVQFLKLYVEGNLGLKSNEQIRKEFFGDSFNTGWKGLTAGVQAPLPNMLSMPDPRDSRYGFGALGNDYRSKSEQFYKMMLEGAKSGGGIPDTGGMDFFTRPPAGEEEDKLGAIARNTERTAKNTEKLDIGKLLFGGGDRAAMGVSMADLGLSGRSLSGGMGRTGLGSYGLGSQPQTKIEIGKPTTNAEAFVAEVLALALPSVLQSLGMEVAR